MQMSDASVADAIFVPNLTSIPSYDCWPEDCKPEMVSTPARKDDGSKEQASGGAANATQASATSKADGATVGAPASGQRGADAPGVSAESMTSSQMSAVLSYFKRRGFKKGEDALKAEMDALATNAGPAQAKALLESRMGSPSVSVYDLAVKSAPREPNAVPSATSNGSGANGAGAGNATAGSVEQAAVEALMLDPTDRARGFAKLRSWCEGSLEIYQPELQPLLLPLFVHSYLDLIELGLSTAASAFYQANYGNFVPQHTGLLAEIRAVALPSHVAADPLAQRFRSERYIVKMSTTVFSLLLGWLTDGGGPAAGAGAGDGVGDDGKGNVDKRAREAMLKIINERLRVQVINAKPQQLTLTFLEEGSGLTGAGPAYSASGIRSRKYPALQNAVVSERDAVLDYNASAAGPQLKLGAQIPLSEKLQTEVDREVREMDKEGDAATNEQQKANAELLAAGQKGLLQPTYADLPPQPPVYRVMDIDREVARIRDARKALRFSLSLNATKADASTSNLSGPSFMSGVRDASFNGLGEEGAKAARTAALPSICSYTYHDADDGLTCSQFSDDLSLMAAGFEESYVQVWSLKGEPLRGIKSDFNVSQIRDRKALDRHREDTVRSTRKLIGHSGPVYSVAFDPIRGSAAPPRHLLSASADATVRLWSLDTFSALVSYRGHQQPIWSVEWSPLGNYFATASADRSARLWSTERVNPLRLYAGHLSDVDCLNFHPNSLYLATGSSDKTCRLWDVQRGACVRLFTGHQSAISCVKISPDGRYLASAGAGNAPSMASAGDDCSISIWDLGSGRRIKKMWGHVSPVLSMAFSVDGGMLVSSGADCQVRCWDVRGAGGVRKGAGFGGAKMGAGGASVGGAGGDGVGIGQNVGSMNATGSHGTSDGSNPLSSSKTGNPAAAFDNSSADCISTLYTKQTPMLDVHFTPRNLCLTAGAFDASSSA